MPDEHLLLGPNDLSTAIAEARKLQSSNQMYFVFIAEPRGNVKKFINLWEGCIGEVIGRTFYNDKEEYNPDLPSAATVEHVIVRVRIIDLLNAGVRAAKRTDRELAAPLRANKLVTSTGPDTQR